MAPSPPLQHSPAAARARNPMQAALFLVLVGVCASLHIWKVPPALPQLQADFGLTLVQSGFLLSVVQMGGMALGLPIGLVAERIGLRRCILGGLGILTASSTLGALLDTDTSVLLGRAAEGLGFLMVVMPIPGLIRRLVPANHLSRVMGLWGCYMPLGTVTILLGGPWVLALGHWQALWFLLAVLTGLNLLLVLRVVPADRPFAPGRPRTRTLALVATTLKCADVWLVALCFGTYASQWVAIIGFLPTIYAGQGISGTIAGVLTAVVAGSNAIGNLGAGRMLHHGTPAWRLLVVGLGTMIFCAWATFGAGLPGTLQFVAIVSFSLVGGLVPATLFVLALTLAPSPQTTSTTIGWMQQCSSAGQFMGAPVVAWVVNRAGGNWQWTWLVTAGFLGVGIMLALVLRGRTRHLRPAH